MKSLVLASGSASRKEILEEAKIIFSIDVSNYEEDMGLDLAPKELAIHLSKGKALEVAERHTSTVVLAADSFGVFNSELLGKPRTLEKARAMLAMLSGQCHTFITGFTVIDTDTRNEYSEAVETRVYFRELIQEEIEDYLFKENVLERAGAYTIQGLGKHLIDRIEGDYNNVRGLPLYRVSEALQRFGILARNHN